MAMQKRGRIRDSVRGASRQQQSGVDSLHSLLAGVAHAQADDVCWIGSSDTIIGIEGELRIGSLGGQGLGKVHGQVAYMVSQKVEPVFDHVCPRKPREWRRSIGCWPTWSSCRHGLWLGRGCLIFWKTINKFLVCTQRVLSNL